MSHETALPDETTQEIEKLTDAVESLVEAVREVSPDPDQRLSGDLPLFSRLPPVRKEVSVLVAQELADELRRGGHRAFAKTEVLEGRTFRNVWVEDEGRGWLRLLSADRSRSESSWNVLVPLRLVEAIYD